MSIHTDILALAAMDMPMSLVINELSDRYSRDELATAILSLKRSRSLASGRMRRPTPADTLVAP